MMYKIVRVHLIPNLEQLSFLEEISYNYTKQLIEVSRHFNESVKPQVYLPQINKIPFNSKYLLLNDISKKRQRKVAEGIVIQYCLWSNRNAFLSLHEKIISFQSSDEFVYVDAAFRTNRYKLQLLSKGQICKMKTHWIDNDWYVDILMQFPDQ